ncbi:TPA: glycosyltransferase family 4 protein [Vibrio parahaemolyticus]
MKIIYLYQYFKKPSMNGGVRSYEFAKRLVLDGHHVIMVTSDTENKFKGWKIEFVDGIEVHWVSVPYSNNLNFWGRILAFLKFIVLASLHLLKIDSDKVIATSTPLTISLPAILYKLIKKKEFIFEVRDVWPEVPIALGYLKNPVLRFIAKKMELLSYYFSDEIIALSPDMRRSILEKSPSKNVTVIPNAADVDLFKIPDDKSSTIIEGKIVEIKKNHEKIVFYTGTFGHVNNITYLIDLASYSTGDIGFIFIGGGKERGDLERYAQDKGLLGSIVHFLDPISKVELAQVHALCDVACSTVLPIQELYANSANKVFDAFASGTPILINHGGWIAEIINHHECGIVLSEVVSQDEFKKLHDFVFDERAFSSSEESSRFLGMNEFKRDNLYRSFREVINGEKTV